MKKIGIVINPHAKRNLKLKYRSIEKYNKIGKDHVDIRITKDLDEVTTVIKDFKRIGISYIAISGGDGTLHHVLLQMMKLYEPKSMPPIVILKDGTMNVVAKSIKLKGQGYRVLSELLKKIKNNEDIQTIKIDTIKVEDRYCFLFGLGLASNFLYEYYKGGDTGSYKALRVIVKSIIGIAIGKRMNNVFKRLKAKAIIDEKELMFDNFIGILAGTVNEIGLGFKPLCRAYERDSAFHLIASGIKPVELILGVNKFRAGKLIEHPLHLDCIAEKMKIIGPPKYQYIMDGELYDAHNELEIDVGPQVELVYM
ncbi:MAG: diacylglycerol kinase family protein [Spirochaetota bacterium]|nr:diacylglycerol kinase family protein [Spirochaetota bacterium]